MERDDTLPRRLDELLAELDRLGQDDLFLGGQQGDLADLLEVHPDRVVDPDHVGGDRLELLGGRLLDLGRVQLGRRVGGKLVVDGLAVLADDLDRDVAAVRVVATAEDEILVVVLVVSTFGRTTFAARRPRVASFASSTSARARRGRVRTASTSCLSSGSAISVLRGRVCSVSGGRASRRPDGCLFDLAIHGSSGLRCSAAAG